MLLGCPYDQKIDIWSLGCILAEIYTGQVLFESDSKVGLLAKMQGLRGPWPSWMLEKGKNVPDYFSSNLVLWEKSQPSDGANKFNGRRVYVPKMTNLKSRLNCSNPVFL